ncbi:hypothetical protein [Borrelia turcica]|uniref:hypothetical protein n=1 Tax=Borrelia turcica TaxID=229155 RepID=UPI001881296B|nr:hypothetical protein [Borrelia turcica]
MRFPLKYLARRATVRRDIFWNTYMSDEIQNKRGDANITNFPVLKPQDMNYDYIYEYVREWASKKYKEAGDIIIRKVDDREYICETKICFRFNKILETLYKDFKQVFLSRLVKRDAPKPQAKVPPQPQEVGEPVVGSIQDQPRQEQVRVAAGSPAPQPNSLGSDASLVGSTPKGKGKKVVPPEGEAASRDATPPEPKIPNKKNKQEANRRES